VKKPAGVRSVVRTGLRRTIFAPRLCWQRANRQSTGMDANRPVDLAFIRVSIELLPLKIHRLNSSRKGLPDNSPAFQRRVFVIAGISPEGTTEFVAAKPV
jgi:hypothetical protein